MNGAVRKAEEMRAKVSSIVNELKYWRDESEADRPWEKHFSQIRRVATPIETAADRLAKDLEESIQKGTVLDYARRLEQSVIDLHSVWEFFRSKLVLRAAPPFAGFLGMADEFAWACYKPALDVVDPMRKEPPLTFFKSDTSPYALSRDHSYRSWIDNDRLKSDDAVQILKSLPIPVIGIPWFQSRHLPDLLIVAHEVGHHVEELGLTTDLAKAVAKAKVPAAHTAAWLSWKGEVFADVFATLAAGPAFTTALIDFLTTAPATIAGEKKTTAPWGDYPTAYLRVLVSAAVLRTQFKTDANAIERSWRDTFAVHAMKDWEKDCEEIAIAILGYGYRNGAFTLPQLTTFGEIQRDNAVTAKDDALASRQVGAIDVRELVAAAALAFAENPSAFHGGEDEGDDVAEPSPQSRLAKQIAASRTAGTRTAAKDDGPQAVAAMDTDDRKTGDYLYDRLTHLA